MQELIRVAVDAMGGDNAPAEIVKGAVEALEASTDLKVILVGQEEAVQQELSKYQYDASRMEVVNATEIIEMAEPPVQAIRSKKDSSIVVAMKLVKNGEADAFVGAGSTGAVLVGGQLIVGRLQFAKMGSIYMENVMGVKNPRVAIVNIGAEEEKGNALVKETFPLLKACQDINFIGSIEARDIPSGYADVIVCEAFAGNIILKLYEGVGATLISMVKKGMMSTLRSKIGALLVKPALKTTLKKFDTSQYGGAPLLGLKGLVVKTHGSSKAVEIKNSILQCVTFVEQGMNDKIKAGIQAEEMK